MELMIVKKIKFWGLVAMMLFVLVACNNGNEYVEKDDLSTPETEAPVVGVDTESSENSSEDDRIILGKMPHLVRGADNFHVTLIDVLTGAELGEFTVESGQNIWDFFDFGNGYFGALVSNNVDDDGNSLWIVNEDTEDDQLTPGGDVLHDEENWRYLVFDAELNVVNEILITDENLQSWNGHFTTHVMYHDGGLVVYYITHLAPQIIYSYNAYTGITDVFLEVDDDTLFFSDIYMMPSGHMAFRATRINDEVDVHYGFIDLDTVEISLFSESNFRPSSNLNGLSVSGSSLLINEDFAAPTMGGGNVLSVDRGEVLVANIETGDDYAVRLNGKESAWASLSIDGNYVVTVDATGNYFRKYEIVSGNLINEVRLDAEIRTGWWLEIIPISESKYAVYSTDNNGDHQLAVVEVD